MNRLKLVSYYVEHYYNPPGGKRTPYTYSKYYTHYRYYVSCGGEPWKEISCETWVKLWDSGKFKKISQEIKVKSIRLANKKEFDRHLERIKREYNANR